MKKQSAIKGFLDLTMNPSAITDESLDLLWEFFEKHSKSLSRKQYFSLAWTGWEYAKALGRHQEALDFYEACFELERAGTADERIGLITLVDYAFDAANLQERASGYCARLLEASRSSDSHMLDVREMLTYALSRKGHVPVIPDLASLILEACGLHDQLERGREYFADQLFLEVGGPEIQRLAYSRGRESH